MAYEVCDSSFIDDDLDIEDLWDSFPDLFDNKDGALFGSCLLFWFTKLYLLY